MATADDDVIDTPKRIGVREFRANLPGLLRQARQGATFLITSHNEVIAEIRPPSVANRPRRQPGLSAARSTWHPISTRCRRRLLAAMEG